MLDSDSVRRRILGRLAARPGRREGRYWLREAMAPGKGEARRAGRRAFDAALASLLDDGSVGLMMDPDSFHRPRPGVVVTLPEAPAEASA